MENSVKTNRLSIVSFISGLIVLLSLGLYWALFSIVSSSPPEYLSVPADRAINAVMELTVPLRKLCALIALVTGILGLTEIKKKDGIEKGKTLAWVGIVLGVGWILFGLLVGITFFLAEILH